MQQLNAQDALLAYGEAAGWLLQLGVLQVYDAGPGQDLGPEQVREVFRQRLPHLPAFRHRMVRVPGGLGRPVWIEDPTVDVAAHIHMARLPGPGTDRQLAALAGDLLERPIDLSGPPWEMWVIEGLSGGRTALLIRLHHSAADGLRGLELQAGALDPSPAAPGVRPGGFPGAGPGIPGSLRLLAGAAAQLATAPVRLTQTGAHLARAARRLAGAARRDQLTGLALPFTAPRTSLNGAVTRRRGYAFTSLPLHAVKAAARQEHVTVTDVVLALTAGALRRYLGQRGELPGRPLIAVVPVGLPGTGTPWPGSGNRWAATFASLATDVADPRQRLHTIAASARAAKAAQRAIGPELWLAITDLPPALVAAIARGYSGLRLVDRHPTIVNLVVSSLRGPPFPVYLAGARLQASYPIGPVADGFGLNVTVISYLDQLDFGLTVCPDLVADPWQIAGALRAESADLQRRYG